MGELFAARSSRWQEEARVPPCGSDDLAVSVRWFRASGGGLRGEVVAENVSGRICRLGRKPGLQPLGLDGQPLGVDQWVTLELRVPPFAILVSGQLASASISWSGWSGRSASGRIVVSWEGGSATVDAAGPIEPGPPERGTASPVEPSRVVGSDWWTAGVEAEQWIEPAVAEEAGDLNG
ncbi:DUF4232 domain-containing protein [Amycolatopsis sp. NPDC026612]|uniref:DUF4232 domain-containing protein n=1 Tax=Amycolatopsis sp. NPDC026612 TaxID=3155466 RepID=UPI003401BC10